ncbi:MAG: hypothetical protein F4X79_09100 [Acidobacteria bacterium]|nr:hypothetical protein [Acidobacteriota bacterium]
MPLRGAWGLAKGREVRVDLLSRVARWPAAGCGLAVTDTATRTQRRRCRKDTMRRRKQRTLPPAALWAWLAVWACSESGPTDPGATARARVAIPVGASLDGALVSGNAVVAGSRVIGQLEPVDDPTRLRGNDAAVPDGKDEDEVVCWYLIIYQISTGEILSETFLGCSSGGSGSENACTQDQRDIVWEYSEYGFRAIDWPCTMFSRRIGDHAPPDIKRGRGTHNHERGYLTPQYSANRAAMAQDLPWVAIHITSEWRCPVGNANVGGADDSLHMYGSGGDFAVAGRNLTPAEYNALRTRALDLGAPREGISGYGTGGFRYKRHIHVDWRDNPAGEG